MRLRNVILALDGAIIALAIYGIIFDSGHGKLALWITVLMLAVAQLWRHSS